jgi:teichuronic acid biosynthesis glycosyltransferase TuaG
MSYDDLLKNTVIGCLTVMIDSSKSPPLIMPSIPSRQPLVLWLKILKETGPAIGLNQILARYRVRAGSISSNKIQAARQVWRVYREYEQLALPTALRYFLSYACRSGLRNFGLRRR